MRFIFCHPFFLFSSSAVVRVHVLYMWPKTIVPPLWPKETKGWTRLLPSVFPKWMSTQANSYADTHTCTRAHTGTCCTLLSDLMKYLIWLEMLIRLHGTEAFG